jgi:hypothetical protein
MLEVEFELSVNVGINVRSQAALLRHLLVKPRARNRLVVFDLWCPSPMIVKPCTPVPGSRSSCVSGVRSYS